MAKIIEPGAEMPPPGRTRLPRSVHGVALMVTAVFFFVVMGAVVMCAVAPFVWEPPDPQAWGLMILIGFLGAIGHFALIKAFDYAQPSLLAPFNYTQLIWATLFGFFMFGDFPDGWTILGALIVAASGLFVLCREHRMAAPA
jgi:drug/metabolite transporter (DMT)-like permease